MIESTILEIAIIFLAFSVGGRLGMWSMTKENNQLRHGIKSMQEQEQMLRRIIESLRQHNHDMKEVNGGSMGHDYTEDADKRHNS